MYEPKNKETFKEKRKAIRKALRKITTRENIIKAVVIISTLALIATSILPYIL